MQIGTHRIIIGDVMDGLAQLQDQSVHMCCTSPPYWGLRDYGTGKWEGGNDSACDHRKAVAYSAEARAKSTIGDYSNTGHAQEPYRSVCGKCGARRTDQQIGLEPTPDAYVARMVAVFREVRRVLRDDGTCWVNLGDSYNGIGGPGKQDGGPIGPTAAIAIEGTKGRRIAGLKPKDLVGIPWRVAFALQADGWYLRSDIIWSKPNPMPESVTDRPTKAHEYLFLLSKSERYHYDQAAIMEPATFDGPNGRQLSPYAQGFARRTPEEEQERRVARSGNKKRKPASARGVPVDTNGSTAGAVAGSVPWEGSIRNKRTVWTVATRPFPEAHFATFPEKLVEPCILAGCPEGGTVLDPFSGSGTTGAVACVLGRHFIGCELNPEYAAMSERRIRKSKKPGTFRDQREHESPLFGAQA